MILPFVRDLLTELERLPAFEQAARHLSLGRGRRLVSGLTATARALSTCRFSFARPSDPP